MSLRRAVLYAVVISVCVSALGCAPKIPPTASPPAQSVSKPTSAPTALPATVVPTAPRPTDAATAAPTPEPAGDAIDYVMPGDDWGFPSPFAFYMRGPGYLRMSYLFDTLVWKDDQGFIPWLAKSWKVDADGTIWTFEIRQGVTWHDGQPFTADDVVFSFTYMKDVLEKGMVRWGWPLGKVASAEILDDGWSVQVTMTEPTAGVLTDLFGSLPIIPKHIWEGVEDPVKKLDAEAVIGTGMFTLVEYNKEEARYVYAANPDFFAGKPTVDRLTFVKVKDQALSLLAGEVDEVGFWGKQITSLREIEAKGGFEIAEGPSHWVLKLYINPARAPLDQREVRQALAYAIDRQAIVDKAQLGGAVVASTGILSPGTYWHNPELPTYPLDRDKAREMLAAAGVTSASLTLLTTPDYVREAELIQNDLAEVGIEVTVKTADRATVDSLLREPDFDLLITGHGGTANPDLDTPSPAWQDDEYRDVYLRSVRTVDDEARRDLVWRMQAIIAEELPVLTLWHPLMWEVYRPDSPAVPFYTPEGVDGGIPTATNKLMFLRRS